MYTSAGPPTACTTLQDSFTVYWQLPDGQWVYDIIPSHK